MPSGVSSISNQWALPYHGGQDSLDGDADTNIRDQLLGNNAPVSPNAVMQLAEDIRQYYPEHIRRCLGTTFLFQNSNSEADSFNTDSREITREIENFLLTDNYLHVANQIALSTGLFDIDDNRFEFLMNIAYFAMQAGVPESVLYDLADRISVIVSGTDEFLYGFMALVSLEVGHIVNWQSRATGGISPDFDVFASTIGALLMSGDISIDVLTIGDAVRDPTAEALYKPDLNAITCQPLGLNQRSVTSFFRTLLHEMYHAYQDKTELAMRVCKSEFQAEYISLKTWLLFLNQFYSKTADEVRATLFDVTEEIMPEYYYLDTAPLECQGLLRSANRFTIDQQEQTFWYRLFETDVMLETEGISLYSTEIDFEQYYKYIRFDSVMQSLNSVYAVKALEAYVTGELDDMSLDNISIADEPRVQHLAAQMNSIKQTTRASTPERYEAVNELLSAYVYLQNVAIFSNPEFADELADLFSNEDWALMRDELILSSHYTFDGI